MVGRVLAHYRLLDLVGAGGMGEVYRARDETHRKFKLPFWCG